MLLVCFIIIIYLFYYFLFKNIYFLQNFIFYTEIQA